MPSLQRRRVSGGDDATSGASEEETGGFESDGVDATVAIRRHGRVNADNDEMVTMRLRIAF